MNNHWRVLRVVAANVAILGVLLVLLALWANLDTSTYAAGFSERNFSKLQVGMSAAEVRSLLGEPLSIQKDSVPESWFYEKRLVDQKDGTSHYNFAGPLRKVQFDIKGCVAAFSGAGTEKLELGLSQEQVLRLLGPPSNRQPARAKTLHYSSPGNAGVYQARMVEIDSHDRVSRIVRYSTHD